MSGSIDSTVQTANDQFERYYTEKLWSWIPEFYRNLDSETLQNGVLRALIEVVASQAAVLRRDVDRVWDDQAIELCDDWAVAYLGELVNAPTLNGFNVRGNRVAAANAVYYQRRSGTPELLQTLIRDTANVEGVVLEAFKRLARFPHRLDADAISYGEVTQTPSGGFANLKNPRIQGLHHTGFDECAHLPDIRKLKGPYGHYGISKVNFHLYVLKTYPLQFVTPAIIAPGRYTLDPMGRAVPLMQRGQTTNGVSQSTMPSEISCRRFNASTHVLSPEALGTLNTVALDSALLPLLGQRFKHAGIFKTLVGARLTTALQDAFLGPLLDATMTPDSPKAVLWENSLALSVGTESNADVLQPYEVIAANLEGWEAGHSFEDFVALAFDPSTGQMINGPAVPVGEAYVPLLHVGQFASVGAGAYARAAFLGEPGTVVSAGTIGPGGGFETPGPATPTFPNPFIGSYRFQSSRTYQPELPPALRFEGITSLTLEADDGTRPLLLFRPDETALNISFVAAPKDITNPARELTIDGLWIAMLAETLSTQTTLAGEAAPFVKAHLIIDGVFDRVSLRHVTLDPGGERIRNVPLEATAIPMVQLEILGQVSELEISSCITGPIIETHTATDQCNAGKIIICDSIVQTIDPSSPAIQTSLAEVHIERSTIIGHVDVAQLYCSDSAVHGRIRVANNQKGCIRYSVTANYTHIEPAAPANLPKQFECFIVNGAVPDHWWQSQTFGSPWYGVWSKTAPEDVTRGASNGSAMGAFNARGLAILLDDLSMQVRRFLPIGLEPQTILEQEQ